MMRENGFEVPVDEPTQAKFAELSLSRVEHRQDRACFAIQPMCHMSHKDLWQLYMLGK